MTKITLKHQLTEFLLYRTPNKEIKVEIYFHDENVWLTQKRMAELFWVQQPAIAKHLKNIFESWELKENSVYSILEYTASDDKKYKTKFYNLDAILSVWYRVNSKQATDFRIWATTRIREYVIKGFVMDDDRLKNGKYFWKDYFRELLERVKSIRTSERRIYLQITDIFAECSIDYDKDSEITKKFYATVQNKFHFAITWNTAAEIIYNKVDIKKDYMWLKTWKNSPDWRILKSDVIIAKNYLSEKEIKRLEKAIWAYFDYIEIQIENRNTLTMESLSESVSLFLEFHNYKILDWNWKISHNEAKQKAYEEYDEFNKTQKINSDFEKVLKLDM